MMTMALRFDHALLAVYDLEAASADFESLGFNIVYGGQHSGGWTHNALIPFADGSYLELIAPTNSDILDSERDEGYLFLFDKGEGFVGFAMLSSDLYADMAAMRGRGLVIGEPSAGGRERSDGQQLRWQSAFLPHSTSPFVMSDDTSRTLRVPADPEKRRHPNAVSGIQRVVVVAQDIKTEEARYKAILGVEPHTSVDGRRKFPMGAFDVTVVTAGGDPDLQTHFEKRGDTPYSITLTTSDAAQAGPLDLEKTRGARFDLDHTD